MSRRFITPAAFVLSAVAAAGRCERVRANLGTTRARGEVDMEITLRKMQHKEDKMQRTASQFQEMEQTVYNSLFTLIKDTSVLRDYAAAALLIINVSKEGQAYSVIEGRPIEGVCALFCADVPHTALLLSHHSPGLIQPLGPALS